MNHPSWELLTLPLSVTRNPTPGVVINRPNGTDVYKGVPKDYTQDVSAAVQMFVEACKSEHFSRGLPVMFKLSDGCLSAGGDPAELPGGAQG